MNNAVVIGGGISGLASAYFLSERPDPPKITILESEDHLGGTIRGIDFGSKKVETGPDSFITRNLSAVDLAAILELSERLVAPATSSAFIYSRSKLHHIPKGTVFGAPSDMKKFLGNSLISRPGQLRAALEPLLGRARIEGDTTVGAFSKKRWGREVTDKLIEPLVGGIHAGTVQQLSLAQCAPQYMQAALAGNSVSAGLKSQMAGYTPNGHPMFYSFAEGLSELVDGLLKLLIDRNVQILTGCQSLEIIPDHDGYEVVTSCGTIAAEGVVCATPAYVTSRLVMPVSRIAGELLGTIEYASPIMTLLAFEDGSFSQPLEGSGVLIPRPNGTLATAVTFATNKWPSWKSEGETLLRISSGRVGDNRAWQLSDDVLVASLESEMEQILGVRARSTRHHISRWKDRIPQFKPFHSELIQRIRDNLPVGIELAGAPFLGVGIPACISSSALAAERLSRNSFKPR